MKCGCAVLLLAVCACACAVQGSSDSLDAQQDHSFVGWLGEAHHAGATDNPQPPQAVGEQQALQVVSWEPRVFLQHGFLTPVECDYLAAKAAPRLRPSVVTSSSAQPVLDAARTSTGMFFNRREDKVVERIEQRIAAWTMLAADHSEPIQVLQYEVGQKYDAHHDFFYHPSHVLKGGNRVATVIMYLTDVEEGGETVFPQVPPLPHQTRRNGWSACGMTGLGVRPRKGDALLFWSLRPDGTFDELTQHASCPVLKGQKVVATQWTHESRYKVTPDGEGPLLQPHTAVQAAASARA